MIAAHSLTNIEHILDPAIRDLVRQRIDDLGGTAFDSGTLGYFLVIEVGDTLDAVHAQVGFDLLCNRFTGIRYDQAEFSPSFEFVEELPTCYDMVFILSDDGYGLEVLIPKTEGIDKDLLAMCQRYVLKPQDSGA